MHVHRPAPGPLAGIRVVDCSTVLAGPLCTMLLADLGADVVKVEPIDGDATRGWGPPWLEGGGQRVAAYFLSINRNKRSLRLDLRQPAGQDVLRDLLATADVFVENFRPGAFDALGFGDDVLRSIQPALVHLAISGYGPTGPDADRPGYDFVLQASAGLMSITGMPDSAAGAPTKVGVAISDVATGLFATVGVLAGLLARNGRGSESAEEAGAGTSAGTTHRETRAGGQRIDVSILASTLAVLVNQAQNAFVTGHAPTRLGNAHPSIVPYETFATADGEIAVAVGSERQWPRLCDALGLAELADDPRFATNDARVRARAELRPRLAERFAARASADWLAILRDADVPAGPINDILAAFEDPQAKALEMTVEVDHPVLGAIRQVGIPIQLDRTPATIRMPPPLLGEHSREILREAGYTDSRIDELGTAGVI